ncbi:retrovirus-related pol polyprotein from transposon TNT 1-94 [Tanacetum coccineum]
MVFLGFIDVLKIESKAKEDKYLDEIIELEKQKNALDNVIYKMGQSMQTMHMLTKPQAFYNETHKTALGYQNHLYLSQAQRKVYALYCGKTIVKQHAALSVIDTEKTLKLDDESKGVSKGDKYANIYKVLALGMYKLDLELLSPMLLRNKEAHVDYLKYTHEHADTLREIVEHARALRHLDSDLDSTYKFTIRVQELLAYVRDTCPSSSRKSEKLIAVTPINKVKKVRFVEPITSSSNIHKQHSVLNANSELICATCNECMFDAILDLCVLDYVNDVNVRSKSKSIKRKMKKVWKLTGKIFTNVGYSWKHTGRTFTIDGNTCPLTRITSTTVVPPKKPISTTLVKKTSPNSNTSGKLKDITNIGSSSKSKNVESKISNNSEPNNNWGSNVSTAPSSSHVHFRFGNDHVVEIKGFGDYEIGNVTIYRVYYVEGLDHNLFSVGQFCDSDLEVAFRKHSCYVHDLEGKSKKHTYKPKSDDSIQEKLYLLHMDLYGPMRIESINEKKYILVIVDDYSRFTWVKFLRSKYETTEIVIKVLKKIQVRLNETVCNIQTDNGTEFVNQTLQAYYDDVRISHQTSVARTPQQNDVAEAVTITCYTQNRSLIRRCHNKTPYELIHDRKPDLTYFYVFGALYYPTNDGEDPGKLKPKADIGIFIGYTPAKKAYRIYNRRTCLIMETIHVKFDELTTIDSEQFGEREKSKKDTHKPKSDDSI